MVVNNPINSAPPVKYTTAPIGNPYAPAPYSNPQNNYGAPAPAPAPTSGTSNNRVSKYGNIDLDGEPSNKNSFGSAPAPAPYAPQNFNYPYNPMNNPPVNNLGSNPAPYPYGGAPQYGNQPIYGQPIQNN